MARSAKTLEKFGLNLRDWQHEIRDKWRGKEDFKRRIDKAPALLQERFEGGDVADAYLAAYALWLADRVGVERVPWAYAPTRIAREPWFSGPKRASLLRDSPLTLGSATSSPSRMLHFLIASYRERVGWDVRISRLRSGSNPV